MPGFTDSNTLRTEKAVADREALSNEHRFAYLEKLGERDLLVHQPISGPLLGRARTH
jgi:hypothetical protein